VDGVRSRLRSSPVRRATPRRRGLGSRIPRRGHLNRSAGGRHRRGQTTPVRTDGRSTCVSPSFRAARPQIMAAEHRNATVVAVLMAGQTADTRRDRTAAVPPIAGRPAAVGIAVPARLTADPVAVGIAVPARLTADPAAAAADIVAAAVLPIADPAAVAVVHAEEAAVRAEEAAVLRMRPRHMVAVEGPIGKIVRAWLVPAEPFRSQAIRFVSLGNDSDSTPTKFEPILRKLLEPGTEAREIRIQLAGAEELQQSENNHQSRRRSHQENFERSQRFLPGN